VVEERLKSLVRDLHPLAEIDAAPAKPAVRATRAR
jgi:hypothetical protein